MKTQFFLLSNILNDPGLFGILVEDIFLCRLTYQLELA